MKRIQIHISEEAHDKLKEIKWDYKTTVSNLIRTSIDMFLAVDPIVKKMKEGK